MAKAARPLFSIRNAPSPETARKAIAELGTLTHHNPNDVAGALADALLFSDLPVQTRREAAALSAAVKRVASKILEQAGSELNFVVDGVTQTAIDGDPFVQLARAAVSEAPDAAGPTRALGRHMLRVCVEQDIARLQARQAQSAA